MLTLKIDTTNVCRSDSFPEYVDPLEEKSPIMDDSLKPKPLARLQSDGESSRGPSPQPSHISVPLPAYERHGHRILRSATVGYIAPEFKGKVDQMKSGRMICLGSNTAI